MSEALHVEVRRTAPERARPPQQTGAAHLGAVANLGQFALQCPSLEALLRDAAEVIRNLLGVDRVVISEGEPLAGGDLTIAITAVPQDVAGKMWGTVTAYRSRDFSPAEEDFVRAVAAVIGQAVARERAEESLRMRAAQQSAIAELSRLMLQSVDDAALSRACDLVMERLGVEYSLFFELDPARRTPRFRAGRSWYADALQTLPVLAMAQAAECVACNEPVVVQDYACDTRFGPAHSILELGIHSGVVVPVSTSSRCLGILTAHSRTARVFTDQDLFYMQSFANILAEGLERDTARRELVASQEQYREVIEGASEVIFTATPDGRFTSINLAFERLTGFRVDAWLGRSILDLVAAEEREWLSARLRTLGTTAEASVAEVTFSSADGPVLVEISMIAKRREGVAAAIFGFARDVMDSRRAERERRVLEQKLEQANRIAGLGRLAATVAHEFNNVLMGISPFVDLVRRGKNVEAALDHISRSVTRGRRITQEILRFTQPSEPSRAVIDAASWLQSIVLEGRSLIAPACTIEVTTTGERLYLDGDPAQLQQVFTNLILNARDAMRAGGQVTIELQRGHAGAKLRVPFAPERFAHFIVRDTGCGMNAEMLRHAFEPLFTTKRNGTGLGLPVALQVVQRHGGEMFIESSPGVGTAFHIFLPLTTATVVTGPQEVRSEPATAKARRVLLVEDDPSVAAGLITLLGLDGVDVRLAETGNDAIAILRGEVPDLVILDVGLPDMDGTQVYSTFKHRLPELPVIFSTGHADRTKLEALLRTNVGFLLKPYDHATLLEMMSEVMSAEHAA